MTKQETLTILKILQASYSRFYQNEEADRLKTTLEVWSEMFENDDVEIVKLATKNLIQHLEFPPTIADVRKEINRLVEAATNKPSAVDEWNAIRSAIGNSIYNAGEMFEMLPPIAKKFVGTPNQLRQWAVSAEFNESVVRGQFLKQYEVIEQREKYKALLSENTVVQRIISQTENKLLGGA